RELIEDRMSHRQGHFMPTALLDSQFATLQPLQPDEAGVAVDVAGTPEEITERAVDAVKDRGGSRGGSTRR
ncbi:gluconokinase, partial [Kitasatospora phosalacinea]